jgi:RimJ/RimL family protein N-acetyltransferase
VPSLPVPTPPLSDGDIVLRPWRIDDVAGLAVACTDPEIPRWTTVPDNYTPDDARVFIAGSAGRRTAGHALELAVVDAADDARLLASIGVQKIAWASRRAEIGYWTAAEARGRGVARRAVALLSAWALRELALTRIEIAVHVDNEPSQRVALSAGYTRQGIVRNRELAKHGSVDVVIFARSA